MWPRHTLGMPWSERPPAWRRHSRPPSRAGSGVRRPHAGLPTAARVVNGPQKGTHSALDAAPMHAPRTVGARARPFPLPRHRSTPARLHPPAGPLPPWGMRGSGAVEQGPRLATARLGAPPSRTPRRVRSWRETGIPATSGHGVDTTCAPAGLPCTPTRTHGTRQHPYASGAAPAAVTLNPGPAAAWPSRRRDGVFPPPWLATAPRGAAAARRRRRRRGGGPRHAPARAPRRAGTTVGVRRPLWCAWFAPARVPARLVRYARALATNDTTAAAATTLARGAAPPRRGGHGHNRTAHGKRPWLLPGRGWPRRPLSPAPRRVDAPGPPRIGGPAHATAIIACSDASHAPCGGACRGCGDGSHSCAEAGGRTPRLAEPHHSSAEADGPMPTARSVMPAPVGPTMHNRRRGQRRILSSRTCAR